MQIYLHMAANVIKLIQSADLNVMRSTICTLKYVTVKCFIGSFYAFLFKSKTKYRKTVIDAKKWMMF